MKSLSSDTNEEQKVKECTKIIEKLFFIPGFYRIQGQYMVSPNNRAMGMGGGGGYLTAALIALHKVIDFHMHR